MAYELFVDSFDTETFSVTGTGSSLTTNRWQITSGSGQTVSTSPNGRRSTASLRFVAANTGTVSATKTIAASTHIVFGAWIKSALINTLYSVAFRNGATALVTVNLSATGKISVTISGTTYNSANTLPSSGAYLEFGLVVGDSGSFEVRVNGTSTGWLALTGVDTKPGAITNVDNIRLTGTTASVGTALVDHDDLYITYGDELKWLGDIRVDALALTGNSTPQDWTPDTGNAWERLNNTSAGYITGTTLDDESLFALADYTPATTAIHGVQVSAYARKTDAGSRSMAIEVKSDTTTDVGDTIALSDTTTEYRQVWLTDPDTAAAWTDGGLDALEIGVKVMD